MLYAWLIIGGGISGGHYNPAVTMGVLLSDRFLGEDIHLAFLHWVAQFCGGAFGCLMAYCSIRDSTTTYTDMITGSDIINTNLVMFYPKEGLNL